MISGVVNAKREAVVPLRACGPQGQEDVEAVLADGGEAVFDIHEATMIRDSQSVTVEVDAAGPTALVGMALLEGSLLSVHAVHGGRVTIERVS